MRVRKNLVALCVLSLGFVQGSAAYAQAEISLEGIPADELDEARQILNVAFPVEEREQIFGEMIDAIGSQVATAFMADPVFEEPGIRKIMDEFMAGLSERLMPSISKHMPSIIEATAVAYTNEFTREELRDIRAFAETESGRRYFRKSSSLLSDPAVAKANEAYFAELQALTTEVREELKQKAINYLIENPEALERISAQSESQ